MNTTPRPNPNSGHLLLAFVLLIACVLIVVVALKILHKIQTSPPDIWHGEDTNDITLKIDWPLTNVTAALREALGSNAVVQVEIQELGVTLPMSIDQLGSVWYERVDHSSNGTTWEPTALEWSEALAINRTNHPGQQGWFRRVILY